MAPQGSSSSSGDAVAAAASDGVRVLKKYPNRRLYDTRSSSYITLADVKQLVLDGERFEVRDAKSGDELTRSILLQIILEEEAGGLPIFSTPMLLQIIHFYGHAMQGVMGSYLEKNLQAFTEFQSNLAAQTKGVLDPTGANADMWARYLSSGQTPLVQMWMNNYLEQSRKLFAQMQEQMLKQAGMLFPGLPPKN